MLRLLLICIPFLIGAQQTLQFPLQSTLQTLVSDPQLKGVVWSICAVDLTTGDTLAAYDATRQIPGASITKLISTAAALNVLGEAHKASTELVLEGELQANGIWKGNLRIIGHGDVSLGSKFFHTSGTELHFLDEWAALLQQKGIKTITGDIIADATAFGTNVCPLGWQQVDMGNYYGCGAYGLNFYDNTLKLNFKTGAPGSKIQLLNMFPSDAFYQLGIEAVAANVTSDQTFIYGQPYLNQPVIKGKLPANRSSYIVKASMPDPERLLADLFYKRLQDSGIRVDGGPTSARVQKANTSASTLNKTLLHVQIGRSLKELVYWTNQRSVNLFAEGNLLQLGLARYGAATYENSLMVLDSLLLVWQIGPCRIVDGSGLSKENRMSAAQFVQLLKVQTKEAYFSTYYSSIPIAGVSGTVGSLCKGQPGAGKVHAKSGSLDGVKSYAGYVESQCGHQIAFAIIANDFDISGAALAKKMEPFLNSLATYQVQP
ncbi:MAG: D-alanyl-D-alanine carboxypeptidase/D-alanyl-D-alanine-endopeptidase [Flavobacteriales bacterium]